MTTAVQQLEEILPASAATGDFKEAVSKLKQGIPSPLIKYNPGVPPVKALRGITKLLEAEPELVVESVVIQGTSGCSTFSGTMTVNGDTKFEFVWDCAWRAKEENLTDHFGYPDQIRAAREFGYQCFQIFRRVS